MVKVGFKNLHYTTLVFVSFNMFLKKTNPSSSEFEVNDAGTAGFIHDRNHAIMLVESN